MGYQRKYFFSSTSGGETCGEAAEEVYRKIPRFFIFDFLAFVTLCKRCAALPDNLTREGKEKVTSLIQGFRNRLQRPGLTEKSPQIGRDHGNCDH